MAEIIKEIQTLSDQIQSLKESIKGYDNEISKAGAAAAKVSKAFSGYKAADASAMSVERLSQAVSDLTKGYDSLSIAEENAKKKLTALQQEHDAYVQLQGKLAQAQRSALRNGDQQEATNIYQQYTAAAQAAFALEGDIRNAEMALSMLSEGANVSAQSLNRYEQVLNAVKFAHGNTNIENLQAEFEATKDILKETEDTMKGYIEQIKKVQAKVAEGKLTPQQTADAQAEIEGLKNKLYEAAEAYKATAEQARVYAEALGGDKEKIDVKPDIEMPEDEIISDKTIENAKELNKELGGIGSMLGDIIKGGLALSGIDLGARSLVGFAKQVMNVRSEFQQLEIAFTTMLGSQEKATKLMQQMTETAAKTPFDLQGVASGAKQLLAYGIAADDVNETLIHLGDIAAGMSLPLERLVYLYGTTMVQGRMYGMDLRQFMNAGIPLAEELAKQFGVTKDQVRDLVSQGKVGAEQFKAAIMSMSSEGGKFGGLMEAQSKTINGQISNIKDKLDMMFNDIGKNSEGAINSMLGGVGTLIEHYKDVGAIIMGLVSAIGAYKAISVVMATVETWKVGTIERLTKARLIELGLTKQSTKSAKQSAAAAVRESIAKSLSTKAVWAHVKALAAERVAMLANPYVLITALLVGLGVAMWKIIKAHQNEKTAIDKINDSYDKRLKNLRDEQKAVNEDIEVLKNEASALNEVLDARERLKKELLKGGNFTGEQLAAMSNEQLIAAIQKAQQEAENVIIEENKKAVEDKRSEIINNNVDKFKKGKLGVVEEGKQVVETADYENPYAIRNVRTKYTEEHAKSALDEILKQDAEIRGEEIELLQKNEDGSKRATKEQIADLTALQQAKQTQLDLDQAEYNLLSQKEELTEDEKNRWALLALEIARANAAVKGYSVAIEQLKNNDVDSTNLQGILYGYKDKNNEQKNGIYAQEKEVERLRKIYAKDSSQDNKTNYDGAVQELKRLTGVYKDMTGQEWMATKEYEKLKTEETLKNARDREDITLQEYSKRVQIAKQKEREIEDLRKEEREWQEKNPTRQLPSYFAEREKVIELKFQADFKQLDEEFNDWTESVQRETYSVHFEIDMAEMDAAIENATTYAEKRILQTAKYEREFAKKEQDLDEDIEKGAKEQYGDKTIAAYNDYKQGLGEWTEAEKATFAEMDRFYKLQTEKRNAILKQFEEQHNATMLQEDLQNFESYTEGILQAEEQYQSELAAIRERYGLSADADVENSTNANVRADVAAAQTERDISVKSVEKSTGLIGNEYVNRLVGLGEEIGNKTKEEIRALYQPLIEELDAKIAELKQAELDVISNAQANIDTKQSRIAEINSTIEGGGLTDMEQSALMAERATLEGEIAAHQQEQADATARLNDNQSELGQLVVARNKAEQIGAQQVAKAEGAGEKSARLQQRRLQASVEALAAVRDIANDVANTFGGALSNKSKKALSAMSGIADFGMSAIQGIETLVKGVSDGMIVTTKGASKAMQTLEKASFILTVISIAVQLITKIVEIASQFTKSAQLQDSIDAHLERVDELKRKNEQLQRAYQDKTGIDYYVYMTKAAKDYDEVIREQNKALADARKLYEEQLKKYGEDSDKTKEAQEQMNEIEDDMHSTMDAQAEQLQEVANSLATTDLSSFSQSLAESIVDGFANGSEGIEDAFDDMLDDLYRSMLTKQLAMALEKQFEPIFDKISAKANDASSLTQSDIEEIMGDMENAKENAKLLADAYYDVFSQAGLLEDADAEGSEGFGQMTQDQADTLTARFTAVQIEMSNVSAATQAMAGVVSLVSEDVKLGVAGIQSLLYNSNIALQMAQDQLDHLQVIADNTAMLAETNARLKAIETNTGRL